MNFSWEMQINTCYPQIKHQQQTKVPFHLSPTHDYVKEHERLITGACVTPKQPHHWKIPFQSGQLPS